jgi:hypothetical protein
MTKDAHPCSAITHVALAKELSHHAVNRGLRPKLLPGELRAFCPAAAAAALILTT